MFTLVLPSNPAVLIGPTVLAVFSLGFIGAWTLDRRRRYLLALAAACLLFFLGAVMQIFQLPPGVMGNAVASTAVYTLSVLVAIEGVLGRSGKSLGLTLNGLAFAAMMGLTAYFAYGEPWLAARIYIQNIGYGALLLLAAYRLRDLASGRIADRILFWVFLVFAAHFIPRTLLTVTSDLLAHPEGFAHSTFWIALHISLAAMGVALALAILGATAFDLIEELSKERDIDALTGVLNRRGFERKASALLAHAEGRVCAIIADIDEFKAINDRFGHAVGDRALAAFGKLLHSRTRPGDVIGRIGGEEFAIVVVDLEGPAAHELAERIRLSMTALRFRGAREVSRVTASFGIAERRPEESLWDVIARADSSLYEAKRLGRNRAIVA